MPQISLNCPYCRTQHVAFEGSLYVKLRPDRDDRFLVLMQCRICGEAVVAKFSSPNSSHFIEWIQGKAKADMDHAQLIRTFPEPTVLEAPEYTPDKIARFYLQGLENVSRNFDAAGVMFRKCLDTALKHFDPDGKGSLQKRIDDLPVERGVTPAMKEWAHEIRDLGNEAAHEQEPFTEREAKDLHSFTELFLRYAFTLPGMIAVRKSKAENKCRS